jgi:N6-L-threonylcarbamoyladenine synthase
MGIETSCDETSVAVIDGDHEILGHVILSQDVHEVFGGVVPQAGVDMHDVDVFGVTAGPGLIGALLVGVCWAKAVAFATGRPLVAVHHMEAHLFGPSLEDPSAEPPFVGLLVSGGHTLLLHAEEWGRYTLLGETRDDAAGEAFDKAAKRLGLAYPGGPQIEKSATQGDRARHRLPRPMLKSGSRPGDADYYDFSFSGLKTAVVELVTRLESSGSLEWERPHVARAFQEAVVEVLASKTMRAVEQTGCPRVLLGGGVSANASLRRALAKRLGPSGRLFFASPRLSLDNGAMVARAARFRYDRGDTASPDVSASASLPFPGLRRLSA